MRTETRIRVPGLVARLQFAAYWRVIAAGSGLLRAQILRAIARQAEYGSHVYH